ncbi:MAG: hypothetical protein CL760_01445 [Chloroflexi bacterium]|nr:hypothetical protein [Chloroflexota bacterium]|tara:strand:+ start:81261 stop:81791 length:531 start_codon:yes stop_codon:yes gene_type:complete
MLEEKYFRLNDKLNPIIFKYKERLTPTVFMFNIGLLLISFIFTLAFFDIENKVESGIFHKDIEAWANTIYAILMFIISIGFIFINYAYFADEATIYKIKYTTEEKSEMLLAVNSFQLSEFDELFLRMEKELEKVGNVFEHRKYLLLQDLYEERIYILLEKDKKYSPKSEYLKLFKE